MTTSLARRSLSATNVAANNIPIQKLRLASVIAAGA